MRIFIRVSTPNIFTESINFVKVLLAENCHSKMNMSSYCNMCCLGFGIKRHLHIAQPTNDEMIPKVCLEKKNLI